MTVFHVTTATTVYETYRVECEFVDEAARLVREDPSSYPSWPDGDNGNAQIINVREAKT